MPHIRIVASDRLVAEDLRATRYVHSPRRAAREVVDQWVKEEGFLHRSSPCLKSLERLVEKALREEGEKAQ